MKRIEGIIYTENFDFRAGAVTVDGDRIAAVEFCSEDDLAPERRGQYILPGLIDIHMHGCAGGDFSDGSSQTMRRIASYELLHGITSICPATMTLPEEKLVQICTVCAQSVSDQVLDGGIRLGEVLRGIYLEGPFLSADRCGAQNPAYLRRPDREMLHRLQNSAQGLIRVVAVAPETEGAEECIREEKDGFCFSVAHTCAGYETARRAMEAGARHVTHLYNAMPPCLHREPGVVGAAADTPDVTVELICDGYHVHPAVVRNTFRLFGAKRVVLVSDSMMAAGMEDGGYMLGDQPVKMRGGHATLSDGTLAGSAVDLCECVRRAVQMGVPAEDVVRAATCNPARVIGAAGEYGMLKTGCKADLIVTDGGFFVREVMKSGKRIAGTDLSGDL